MEIRRILLCKGRAPIEQVAQDAARPGDDDDLPASVAEIAGVIGRAPTLKLLSRAPACVAGKPGKRGARVMLYVPKNLAPDHWIVGAVGAEKALALVRAFGGEVMQPANCRRIYAGHRDDAIVRMLQDGARVSTVLEMMRVSRKHVVKLAKRRGLELPQLDFANRQNHHADDGMQLTLELRCRRG